VWTYQLFGARWDVRGTHVRNAPRRGPAVGIAAVASALLVGTGAAQAATNPPPGTAARAAVQAPGATRVVTLVTPAPRIASATIVTRALPRAYRLTLRGQYQLTNYYCVPASTAMSLSTFGVRVGQATLAQQMRTTLRGTGGDSAASVIDTYIHPRRFDDRIVADVVGRPQILMQRVSYDVGSLHRAPVIQVWMERLPWNQRTLKGHWIGHAIVAYGYDQRAGTITVFDPWRPTGGTHTLSVNVLSMALQSGAGMHYISRM
jgi:hypothetical protein